MAFNRHQCSIHFFLYAEGFYDLEDRENQTVRE